MVFCNILISRSLQRAASFFHSLRCSPFVKYGGLLSIPETSDYLRTMSCYHVIGIMSGTSLDGLDLAYCRFDYQEKWTYQILVAETITYPAEWDLKLRSLHLLSGEELLKEHESYGTYIGQSVAHFMQRHHVSADFIASHGHTVFHQPQNGFTFQAGDGAAIAAACGLPVVSDFRSADVALGGQGAPLVPIGDRLLFSDFGFCLNLGGIANISFEKQGQRVAYDVCPCNLLLNYLAQRLGKSYDRDGDIAATGKINPRLLQQLDDRDFYSKPFPKSLGREDIEQDFLPLLDAETTVPDLLATVCAHIAKQVARSIPAVATGRILVTGGGAFNTYLLACIRGACAVEIVSGSPDKINFKEALIFAFLGVLRWRNENNVLSSVTGATRDHCSGSIDLP